ncbi:MAG: helix-turn-helix domain-containing protein [Planctomycetes bacterium]|nr:helix-turn-helix domain-containing protein [Planctomycetota bacterium]
MANPVTTSPTLRQRLRQVAGHFSQAEIARRTGVSKANVHRYLRAGKVPGDFVVDLTREFGLSPAWVLQGHGAMLAAQVSNEAADESRRLLEVVLKLNAVGHEKLASLLHNDAGRGMRELADAIERHEQLRARLSQRARPLATKMLNETRDALAGARIPEAEAALAAVVRLDRMVNQPQLTAARNMLEGTLASYLGDLPRQRRAHLGALGALMQADRLRDRQFLRTCYNYCAGLVNAGRLHESARTADAMLLLAGTDPPQWPEDRLLHVPRAMLLLHSGRLIDALPVLTRVLAGCSDEVRPFVEDLLALAHFLGGAPARLESLLPGNELDGLLIALLCPQPETLAALHRRLQRHGAQVSRQYVEAARCLATGKGEVKWENAPQPVTAFANLVLETELRMRRGQHTAATRALNRARLQLQQLDAETTPHFAAAALHHRQAARLCKGKPAQQAQAWLKARIDAGYLCLRGLTED